MTIANAAAYNKTALRNGWFSLCDATANFNHPDLRRLLGVWRRAVTSHGLPRKSDMTERVLHSFRRDIAFYEKVAGKSGSRRWRVERMGASLAQIMGDLSGRFLDEVIDEELLPRWNVALDATVGEGAPLRFLSRNNRMSFLNGEFFSAPLIGANGSASFVLAAGRFSSARRWQDIEAEAKDRLGL